MPDPKKKKGFLNKLVGGIEETTPVGRLVDAGKNWVNFVGDHPGVFGQTGSQAFDPNVTSAARQGNIYTQTGIPSDNLTTAQVISNALQSGFINPQALRDPAVQRNIANFDVAALTQNSDQQKRAAALQQQTQAPVDQSQNAASNAFGAVTSKLTNAEAGTDPRWFAHMDSTAYEMPFRMTTRQEASKVGAETVIRTLGNPDTDPDAVNAFMQNADNYLLQVGKELQQAGHTMTSEDYWQALTILWTHTQEQIQAQKAAAAQQNTTGGQNSGPLMTSRGVLNP